MLKQTIKNQSGFTLIEMLIAMTIFAMVALIAADIFLASNRSQRKVLEIQRVHSDARFAIEMMTREIRMGTIDYDYYGGTAPQLPDDITVLALRDIDNNLIVFKKTFGGSGDSVCPDTGIYCLQVGLDVNDNDSIDANEWASITPSGVEVVNLLFFIDPDKNPYEMTGDHYSTNSQPRVTIVLTTVSTKPTTGGVQPEKIYLQTTVTSRVYRR